jgi:hypothetical protein
VQDRYDNHFDDSPVWQRELAARAPSGGSGAALARARLTLARRLFSGLLLESRSGYDLPTIPCG